MRLTTQSENITGQTPQATYVSVICFLDVFSFPFLPLVPKNLFRNYEGNIRIFYAKFGCLDYVTCRWLCERVFMTLCV